MCGWYSDARLSVLVWIVTMDQMEIYLFGGERRVMALRLSDVTGSSTSSDHNGSKPVIFSFNLKISVNIKSFLNSMAEISSVSFERHVDTTHSHIQTRTIFLLAFRES